MGTCCVDIAVFVCLQVVAGSGSCSGKVADMLTLVAFVISVSVCLQVRWRTCGRFFVLIAVSVCLQVVAGAGGYSGKVADMQALVVLLQLCLRPQVVAKSGGYWGRAADTWALVVLI